MKSRLRQAAVPVTPGLDHRLTVAVDSWRQALGSEHVVVAGAELELANRATFTPSGRVLAIIRPSTTPEVQRCLAVAQRQSIPLYAVSRGRNWGYGSRTPPLGEAVLMELRRMDQILEFDEELAFARIQPGVTFKQLWKFLRDRGSRLQIEATAGPDDGSVIGNALERGRSHGPTPSAGRPVGDFQVVLADGRVVHSSSRRFEMARHAATEPFPLGPEIAGLFYESNLGVVTEMTLWLARRASHTRVLRLGLRDEESMRRLIVAARSLMLDGVLMPGNLFMQNDTRRQHALRQGDQQVLPKDYRVRGGRPGLPLWPEQALAWLCTVTVHGSDQALVGRRCELVREALCPHAAREHQAAITGVGAKPHPEYLRNPLWSKRTPRSPDLDRDRVGFIVVAPVAPAVPAEVSYVYETTRDLMRDFGFEPYINLRFWDARSVLFVGSIVYDLELPDADARAVECYHRILETLGQAGYLPYRLPTFAMQRLPRPVDDWGSFWADIRRVLDPHDILAPGRYDFRYCWPSPAQAAGVERG